MVFAWIEGFNNTRRVQAGLGYLSPKGYASCPLSDLVAQATPPAFSPSLGKLSEKVLTILIFRTRQFPAAVHYLDEHNEALSRLYIGKRRRL